MYFLILLKEIMELIIKNQKFTWLTAIVFTFLSLVIILGGVGLWYEVCHKKQESKKVFVLKKNNITDQHFLGYFSLFVLFAVTFDMSRLSMFLVFIVILVMIGIVYIKNKLFYINPFLNILGYNFYEISYEENSEEKTAYIFFRGNFMTNREYSIKIKNENFAFVDKDKKR